MKNIISTIQNSLIQEDVGYLDIQKLSSQAKVEHKGVFWKSWVWKSFLVSALIASQIKTSIQDQMQADNTKENDTFIVVDIHNSNIPLIKGLYKKLLDDNKNYSAYSICKEYSKNWINNEKVNFDWYILNEKLIFNPLYSEKLNNNIDLFEIFYVFVIEWLKNLIWNFSSLWWRNGPALETAIKWYLLFNIENHNLNIDKIYSLTDVFNFFDTIIQKKSFPTYISQEFSKIMKSKNEKIRKIWTRVYNSFKYLLVDVDMYETAKTKLSIFDTMWESFWYELKKDELTLDVYDLIAEKKIDVDINLFNLEDYWNNERKAINAFLTSGAYIFGSKKDHLNANLGYTFIFEDEYQFFCEITGSGKWFLINEVERILCEHRKKKVIFCLIFQYLVKEYKELINNMWVLFVFALPDEQANMFTANLSHWIKWNLEITEKYIWNLKRWEFYCSIDTTNNWLCTIFWKSLDLNNEEQVKILLS